MQARELLQQGKLREAIDAATAAVKGAPTDTGTRILLFELLSAAGEWERARKQLAVVADQAPDMAEGVRSYQGLLEAEQARARLFSDGTGAPQRMTLLPLDPEPHLGALRRLRAGDPAGARALLAAGPDPDERPATVDGVAAGPFRDADDLLAPVLEVFANGLYGWIPIAQVARLAFEPVKTFRDLLWRPVAVTLVNGAESTLLLPTRYPLTERADDPALLLARATDWRDEGGVVSGVGQRAFLAADDLRYALEIQTVEWAAAS